MFFQGTLGKPSFWQIQCLQVQPTFASGKKQRAVEDIRYNKNFTAYAKLIKSIEFCEYGKLAALLYVGSLVISQTTAPNYSTSNNSTALLTIICLILATLTIAARCCANAAVHPVTPPIVQRLLNEAQNYKSNQHYFSSILLLRLLPGPSTFLQSDIRLLIPREYKTPKTKEERRKRELKIIPETNEIADKGRRFKYRLDNFAGSIKETEKERSEIGEENQHKDREWTQWKYSKGRVPIDGVTNSSESALNKSVGSINSVDGKTLYLAGRKNREGSTPGEEDNRTGLKRPMPPAHDHGDSSCKYHF